jgi:hypothetical protein
LTDRIKRNGDAPDHRDEDHRDGDQRDMIEDRVWTDEERMKFLQIFREESQATGLPAPPRVRGYHSFWASTTNEIDSVPFRIRIGYTFITPEEVGPEWRDQRHYDAADPGKIRLKELVAMKIPLPLFETYMRENHHDKPLREEAGIAFRFEALANEVGQMRSGARVFQENDNQSIVQRRRAPVFATEAERS